MGSWPQANRSNISLASRIPFESASFACPFELKWDHSHSIYDRLSYLKSTFLVQGRRGEQRFTGKFGLTLSALTTAYICINIWRLDNSFPSHVSSESQELSLVERLGIYLFSIPRRPSVFKLRSLSLALFFLLPGAHTGSRLCYLI